MEKVKEFLGNISKTGWIIISLVIAVVLLIIVGFLLVRNGVDLWPFDNSSEYEEINEEMAMQLLEQIDETIKSSEDTVLTAEDVLNGGYGNSIQAATQYVQNTQEVNVATYLSSEVDSLSCGQIVFVTTRVPDKPAIINETLSFMFADRIVTDFMPGNIIPKNHPNLIFDGATLEDGVAQVYLTGEFNDGVRCSKDFALIQIIETVKIFETVSEVEVYLNLEKVN